MKKENYRLFFDCLLSNSIDELDNQLKEVNNRIVLHSVGEERKEALHLCNAIENKIKLLS